jgi:Na+-transporting methylmalonyl-CoA/oxaloacetate decarboxylase beta subunit
MKVKRKIIKVVTVLSAGIFMFNLVYYYILPALLFYIFRTNIDITERNYVGIIGGADGPTSIILTSSPFIYYTIITTMVFNFIGVAYLVITKRKRDS